MKHNVESEPKGHDEERIPKKEREEGLENLVNRFDNCFELWKTNLKLEISVMIILNFEEEEKTISRKKWKNEIFFLLVMCWRVVGS